MPIQRCPSPICGRPFQVNQFDTRLATSIERGRIACPHCGMLLKADNDSVFMTHALTPDEEVRYAAAEDAPREEERRKSR